MPAAAVSLARKGCSAALPAIATINSRSAATSRYPTRRTVRRVDVGDKAYDSYALSSPIYESCFLGGEYLPLASGDANANCTSFSALKGKCCNTDGCNAISPKIACYESSSTGQYVLSSAKFYSCFRYTNYQTRKTVAGGDEYLRCAMNGNNMGISCCDTRACNAQLPKISCNVGAGNPSPSAAIYESCSTYEDENGNIVYGGETSENCTIGQMEVQFIYGAKNFKCCKTPNCNVATSTAPPKIQCYDTQQNQTATLSAAIYGSCVTYGGTNGSSTVVRGVIENDCGYYGTLPGAKCCNSDGCNTPPTKIGCVSGNQFSNTVTKFEYESCVSYEDPNGIIIATGVPSADCMQSMLPAGIKNFRCCFTNFCNTIKVAPPTPAPDVQSRRYRCFQTTGKLSNEATFRSCGVKIMHGHTVSYGDEFANCSTKLAPGEQFVRCCTGHGCNEPVGVRCYTTSRTGVTALDSVFYQSCAIVSMGSGTVLVGDMAPECAMLPSAAAAAGYQITIQKCCNTTGCNALSGGSICKAGIECRSGKCLGGKCGCSETVGCGNGQWCEKTTGTCTQRCRRDGDCTYGSLTKCDTKTSRCTLPCSLNTCGTGRACIDGACVNSCTSSAQCGPGKLCSNQQCVIGQCTTDSHCATRIGALPSNATQAQRQQTICDSATRTCVSPLISCIDDRTGKTSDAIYRTCLSAQVTVPGTTTVVTQRRPGVFGAERIGDCGRAARLFDSLPVKCCSGQNLCNTAL